MRNHTRGSSEASPVATPATPTTDIQRRRFLLSLGASGAGAAAVAVAALPGSAIALEPGSTDPADATYRETEHVRDYYRTTRL
jgi:hypothetical protein